MNATEKQAERADLGQLEPFNPHKAIGVQEACEKLLRGRGGRPLNVQLGLRYAKHGCRPLGKGGPVVVLPTVKYAGQRMLMTSWAVAFERKRIEVGAEQARR